ncbi:permease-like cell division protein FtsX [Saccharothrix coeruleofusca]|uniref:Cell division protein FtsX n=1 Tax=Saccharothrix coeruleofusca TaxID=33919 RepID=A0A918AM73_9PSEU|nr:permease-like cell division protein FtsX [Saccharothrix coeruleofusca]MBP2333860.1 cell division transport system permease protein [Saccharothrix coeruleofusca]GGP45276.1 cell division protein FtsX [Saccharothrix coeruleofusca]
MRTSFVFSEVVTGLRRNVTMTIAMILTTAISLFLFGVGLLIVLMVGRMQDDYLSQLEVSVLLTSEVSANDKDCTQQPCAGLRSALETTSGVESVVYENREKGYERFKKIFEAQPELVKLARPEAIPSTFRVKLEDPERADVIVQAFTGKAGVKSVNDQGQVLSRLSDFLTGVRDGVLALAVLQAFAALLLISNTIQLSAYTRRTEVNIMRLVGATRWYTQLPFLIEAVVAGIIGAVGAVGLLAVFKLFLLDRVLGDLFRANIFSPLNLLDVLLLSPVLLGVSVLISALTGYVTLRLYVRL